MASASLLAQPPSVSLLRNSGHAAGLTAELARLVDTGVLADVKLVCGDPEEKGDPEKVLWAHRLLLGSVSPFLRRLMSSAAGCGDCCTAYEVEAVTLHLPHVRPRHLRMALDYLYTGAMYLTAGDLAHVLRVIEMLRMTCGVSVSKMVQQPEQRQGGRKRRRQQRHRQSREPRWVEEAKFEGLEQLKRESSGGEEEPDSAAEELSLESKLAEKNVLVSPVEVVPTALTEVPVEVEPVHVAAGEKTQRRISQDQGAVELIEECDSDDEDEDANLSGGDKDSMTLDAGFGSALHSCVMCGKTFLHRDNLRVHIQSHLGANAQLHTCTSCRRNFRSSLDLKLHMNSHRYTKILSSRSSSSSVSSYSIRKHKLKAASKIIARTLLFLTRRKREREKCARSRGRRLLARVLKRQRRRRLAREKAQMERKKKEPVLSSRLKLKVKASQVVPPSKKIDSKTCTVCVKTFCTERSLWRHVLSQHKASVDPKKKNRKRKDQADNATVAPPPKRPKQETDFTCPTCDKTFPARSIYDRHLKTSKHGVFEEVSKPPAYLPVAGAPPLPHFNQVLQPTMEVGGKMVNKYECHLCNKVFLRVRDLARHREKTCVAWMKT